VEIIGRKIAGKFSIEAFIGGGAMGAVYRAKQIELDKDVAIKVLHDKHAQEQSFVARFKREAKAASLIDHPNSMRVLDFGQEPDGMLYIAMELLEGPSLHRIIQNEGPLETPRIINLARQILAALAAAHDLQILHRDLKPENIIVTTKKDDEGHGSELVKVCDFGIAKMGASSADSSIQAAKLTNAGSIVGTPDYMSPEQARGKGEVDSRSDLYSVGVILYEMMTGRVPFKADTPLGVVLSHINDQPPPPSEINPHCDPKLEAVCMRALSKSPDDRYASAREMRAALADGGTQVMSAPVDSVRLPQPSDSGSGKRGLVLAPEPSLATSDTMIADAPPSEPIRPPMTSAMAALMDPPDKPKKGSSPLGVIAILLILAGGGAAAYWFKFRTVPSETPAPIASLAIVESAPMPNASVSAVAPTVTPSVSAVASTTHMPSSSVATTHPTSPVSATTPMTSASTSASAVTSVAAPPPSPLHVVVGPITADHITPSEVLTALPVARFDRCYRDAVGTQVKPPTGDAKLHLTITQSSIEASFAGSPELANEVGGCISKAAGSMNITLADGTATADVDLSFKD
jgi:eukaryotic-like serine/threonine-protein kinase